MEQLLNNLLYKELVDIATTLNIDYACTLEEFSAISTIMQNWHTNNIIDLNIIDPKFDKNKIKQLLQSTGLLMMFRE